MRVRKRTELARLSVQHELRAIVVPASYEMEKDMIKAAITAATLIAASASIAAAAPRARVASRYGAVNACRFVDHRETGNLPIYDSNSEHEVAACVARVRRGGPLQTAGA